MKVSVQVKSLEDMLDNFSPLVRRVALEELAARMRRGEMSPPLQEEVNLHYHTFFSFNSNGWSPSRIAWEAKKYGLAAAGIVDFDVLDGMGEFLSAGELLDLKTTVALETRVFISELAEHVMSSPNEPGIAYFMASGCFKVPLPGTEDENILRRMRGMAQARNLAVMERVNAYLADAQLDYAQDVVPLTPSGNATERHLLTAYDAKARSIFTDESGLVRFWAAKLALSEGEVSEIMKNAPKFHEVVRSKLMKLGGPGYVAPKSESFPTIEEAVTMIRDMEALPMIAWLDGTNSGEADIHRFLSLLESKGVVAMNIIPDRNWNIADPKEKALKVAKLYEAVEAAGEFDFPISVGTEMNKAGLPFMDNFQSVELQPLAPDFIRGARTLWGHILLARHARFGYWSDGAAKAFGQDRAAKNRFFERAGTPAPTRALLEKLSGRAGEWTAEELERIFESGGEEE